MLSEYKRMQQRDRIYEGIVAKSCETCGKTLERKYSRGRNPRPETWIRFKERRTCGTVWSKKENHYIKTPCLLALMLGKKNGNWKGGLNKCLMCKKEVGWYASKNSPQLHCWKCNIKRQTARLKSNPPPKGVVPPALVKYGFKKGRIATNKIYDFCTVKDCGGKHIAKGLCGKHYQQIKKV